MRYRELLPGDLLTSVAQYVGVFERDVREQDDLGVDHVRRVEPTAEPGLDHGDIDFTPGELGECGGGQDLELRRAERFGGRTDSTDRPLEVRFGAVDPDPLRPPADVRRGVRARSPPLGA